MFSQFLGFINHDRRGLLNLPLKPTFHALTLPSKLSSSCRTAVSWISRPWKNYTGTESSLLPPALTHSPSRLPQELDSRPLPA